MSAISSLEPVDRTIQKMTLVDGHKPGVIAERLGLSSDVVRQRKLRAIRRVTELVRGESQRETSGHNTVGRARSSATAQGRLPNNGSKPTCRVRSPKPRPCDSKSTTSSARFALRRRRRSGQ